MAKKSATKKPRKSRAKAASKGPTAAAADPQEEGAPTPPDIPLADLAQQNPIFEQSAKVGRNADQHTRDAKRQKAIVDVVLSMAGVNLLNLDDDGGELQQVGVTWDSNDVGVRVPYHEIVAAFVAQAPYLAESIKVDDQR